jgi:hypothetical protein
MKLAQRLTEPSTYAGLGVVAQQIPGLIAAPVNPMGWMTVIGGLLAIFMPEKFLPSTQVK